MEILVCLKHEGEKKEKEIWNGQSWVLYIIKCCFWLGKEKKRDQSKGCKLQPLKRCRIWLRPYS